MTESQDNTFLETNNVSTRVSTTASTWPSGLSLLSGLPRCGSVAAMIRMLLHEVAASETHCTSLKTKVAQPQQFVRPNQVKPRSAQLVGQRPLTNKEHGVLQMRNVVAHAMFHWLQPLRSTSLGRFVGRMFCDRRQFSGRPDGSICIWYVCGCRL